MKHFGDITKISGFDIPLVDIVTGGSPCQDLSVAGKRAGLDGERSGLFMEQIRIIKEMREHDRTDRGTDDDIRPRYMVWENVPGAFSSNKGEDFRCVLEETARIADKNASIPRLEGAKWSKAGCIVGDGWSIAWRLHDAQFWGVPQRRKRICLLADLNGNTAAEILFELLRETDNGVEIETELRSRRKSESEIQPFEESLSGNTSESRNQRERTSTDAERSVGETSGVRILNTYGFEPGVAQRLDPENRFVEEATPTLRANMGDNQTAVIYNGASVTSPINASSPKVDDPCHTLTDDSRNHVICIEGNGQRDSHKGDGYRESETMYTLNTVEQHGVMLFEPRSQDGAPRIHENNVCPTLNTAQGGQRQPCIVDENTSSQEPITLTTEMTPQIDENGIGFSLRSRDYKDPPVVSYGLDRASFNQGKNAKYNFSIEEEKIGAQVSRGPGAVCQTVVRRLTPMECERLQGFPDHWTDIGEWVDSKGKKHKDADSPRYKALGNSIAIPFWEWLAKRIVAKYNRPTTMASLFDGIGGFPLSFSRAGCEPIWASEIEEFPIAVTKLRFPDKEDSDD